MSRTCRYVSLERILSKLSTWSEYVDNDVFQCMPSVKMTSFLDTRFLLEGLSVWTGTSTTETVHLPALIT
jgi:hypothetical protein